MLAFVNETFLPVEQAFLQVGDLAIQRGYGVFDFFRVHNRDDQIHNLYFVGAGTHPGAGIPGVIGSAKATAGLMLADLGVT